MNPTIETLGRSLDHWQALYILAITVAVLSTVAIIICAFHLRERLLALKVSNYIYVAASLFAVITTIVIVNKTKSLDAAKDRQLAATNAAAQVEIENAKRVAAQALADAATANQKAQEASKDNSLLQLELAKHEAVNKKTTAELAKKNESTDQFTHALALQQQTMAQQIHTSPELNGSQIEAMTASLKPFAGQKVEIHATLDTVVGRLAASISQALRGAGIDVGPSPYSVDMGALYQGVTIAVHASLGHPTVADALVTALRQQGIVVRSGSADMVPVGKVFIYLGPQ